MDRIKNILIETKKKVATMFKIHNTTFLNDDIESASNHISSFVNKLVRLFQYIILGILFPVMLFLTINSFFQSARLHKADAIKEIVYYSWDRWWLNIIITIVFFAIAWICWRYIKKLSVKWVTVALVIWTILLGVAWIYLAKLSVIYDSKAVYDAASKFIQGDFSPLKGCYFRHTPYQLGYTLFCEILLRIFPFVNGIWLLQFVNVVSLALSYVALICLIGLLYKNKKVQTITAILFALFVQPLIFSSFVYGIFPSFMLSCWAITTFVYYKRSSKKWSLILSAVLLTLSIALKVNNQILLVVLCAIAFFYMIQNRERFYIIFIALSLIMSFSVSSLIVDQYEMRGKIDLGDSIPMTSWLTMGFQESIKAPGWYNNYVWNLFDSNQHNAEDSSKQAVKDLTYRAGVLLKNPLYMTKFFYRKAVSQWNEPTFECIWFGWTRNSIGNRSRIANSMYNGSLGAWAWHYMNFYQQFIYVFFAYFLWRAFKRRDLLSYILPLFILGGFMYHILFEAKSQYALTYFLLMIPLAAVGLNSVLCQFEYFISKKWPKRLQKKVNK